VKYIVTENTITVVFDNGSTFLCDKSHDHFEEMKEAIDAGKELDIAYFFNKDQIDRAAEILLRTGGDLTEDIKKSLDKTSDVVE
jgi:hypothetical protein